MWHALSGTGRLTVSAFLSWNPLIAFDFDGTLAPIVPEPGTAELSTRTAALLAQLTSRCSCIIVSGRSRADVMKRLGGIPVNEVVGNHGSEPWVELESLRTTVESWLPALHEQVGVLPGVLIEDKGCSVSIHYRHAPSRHIALRNALAAARQLGIRTVIRGKCVLNLMPDGALLKGAGLCRAMTALNKAKAIYIGDDETDEDVFRLPPNAGVLGIRVDYRVRSYAPLYLYGQPEVDALLTFLTASLP